MESVQRRARITAVRDKDDEADKHHDAQAPSHAAMMAFSHADRPEIPS
jgi:hypothetical protein